MAEPVANKIILPLDTGNAGKNVRTQTRVVGSDTVHEHYFVQSSPYSRLGTFLLGTTQFSVQASAQNATSTGFLWLQLPAASTADAILRSWSMEYNSSAATAMPTAPVISLVRFTFSGTASGASLTPGKARTSEAANQLIVRTAVTGMTVTPGATVGQSSVPSILTAVGIYGMKDWLIQEGGDFETNDLRIVPGDGLVLYQTVAGTTADVRRFTCDIKWDEVENT